MEIRDLFNPPKYISYQSAVSSSNNNTLQQQRLDRLKKFFNSPIIPVEDTERAKKVVEQVQEQEPVAPAPTTQATPAPTSESSDKKAIIPEGPTMTISGFEVPKTWVEGRWKQECGSKFGELSEKHRKGEVCRDNNGKPDNKRGAKTYGAGLLFNPETGHYMQDDEPAGGFTTEELTRLFMVHLEKEFERAKAAGCKTWYQAAAYGGVSGNFGDNHAVTKKLRELIKEGASDDVIFNHIAHASDSQRHTFPGLVPRRMWEARQWKGDYDAGGYHSDQNKKMTQELNPGGAKKSLKGGILDIYKQYNLGISN